MTSTQLHPSPPLACPDWCEHPDRCAWDQLSDSGKLLRSHDIRSFPIIAREGHQAVQAYVFAEEYADGTPVKFGVTVEGEGLALTTDQATILAQQLAAAVQTIQDIEGRMRRDAGGEL